MDAAKPLRDFISALQESLQDGGFATLSLAHYRGQEAELKRVLARRAVIRQEEKLSFTYRYATRDIVKNYVFAEAVAQVESLLAHDFHAALLRTTAFDLHLQRNPAGKVALRRSAVTHRGPAELTHDRLKKRLIRPHGQVWMHALSLTDAKGAVRPTAQDKYRQINRYVEILSPLIERVPAEKLARIVDMGCGKGYLTFALYDYLAQTPGHSPEIIGVDTRADMVKLCNGIAERSGFARLHFVEDTIAHYDAAGVDLLIALHACDTATDEAIAKGILAQAALIVVAPCCHKQIRRQIDSAPVVRPAEHRLVFLTRHGIFAERQAEMVTDGLRASILEYFGYSARIFEFISDAHTPKNIMIVAEKRKQPAKRDPERLAEIQAAKAYFGIERHFLESLLSMEDSPSREPGSKHARYD